MIGNLFCTLVDLKTCKIAGFFYAQKYLRKYPHNHQYEEDRNCAHEDVGAAETVMRFSAPEALQASAQALVPFDVHVANGPDTPRLHKLTILATLDEAVFPPLVIRPPKLRGEEGEAD